MEALLASEHALAVAARAQRLRAQVRLGRQAEARAQLEDSSEHERDSADMRLAAAVIALADRAPEQALDVLAPVLERTAPALHQAPATVEAHVLDAAAREQLGDEQAAEASLERALDAAEPEGILLPFVLHPLPDVFERLRRHRTAHATLRQTILDLQAGERAAPPAPLREELSEAELRVVRYLPSNLKASEIASELTVSTNTIRTHLRHIYAKLDAHGRTEAVVRARELGLLAPAARPR